ncbi:hypothetical protein [Endozoicomonas sp. GU-1]|uniref:hypothetical protein n=1 Tax=Endozoicomonas sp. GU-1 TaxID=3009078 RepID=UPI0022B3BB4B|nr:hypothetical protein [Endozoicomonas sp. GU-1]WBA80855.1 hypothetical protein O2T12_21515 [Endozoicomonas sp. GU-1]WBA88419.1 hypothetical protein O3276_10700 [Endozoicomonas sp. GU-1]
MDNVHSASSCFLCLDTHAPDSSTPPADDDMVKCAGGHAFHRSCLIQRDCFRCCPQTDCNAHIPCFVKPLADRLARSLLPYIGLDELLDRVVMTDALQAGVSLENARQFVSESEFLSEYLRRMLPGSISSVTFSLVAIIATSLITNYLLPPLPDFFGSRDDSASPPMEEVLVPRD